MPLLVFFATVLTTAYTKTWLVIRSSSLWLWRGIRKVLSFIWRNLGLLLDLLIKRFIVSVFIPSGSFIVLLYHNFRGYYWGSSLPIIPFSSYSTNTEIDESSKSELLQWVAKILELFCLFSMGLLLKDMVHLCEHFHNNSRKLPERVGQWPDTFSHPFLFMSKGFWLGMKDLFSLWGWWSIISFPIILVYCFVATTVGPSGAILLIPTNQTWETPHLEFEMNGTTSFLWPSELTEDHVGGPDCLSFDGALANPSCNAGGFADLQPYFPEYKEVPWLKSVNIYTSDRMSDRLYRGFIRSDYLDGSETWTRAPHAATVAMQNALSAVWSEGLPAITESGYERLQYALSFATKTVSETPIVRTACLRAENLNRTESGQLLVPFPVLPEYNTWSVPTTYSENRLPAHHSTATVEVSDSLWEDNYLSVLEGSKKDFLIRSKTHWILLPESLGSTSTGALILFSRDPLSETSNSKLAIACSVDARWAPGENSIVLEPHPRQTVADTIVSGEREPPTRKQNDSNLTLPSNYILDLNPSHHFLPSPEPGSRWRRLKLSPKYLSSLTPIVPDRNTDTISATLEDRIPQMLSFSYQQMTHQRIQERHMHDFLPFIEHVLATVTVDGISRVGSRFAFQGADQAFRRNWRGQNPERFSLGGPENTAVLPDGEYPQRTLLSMNTSVGGYAYKVDGTTGRFAWWMGVVFLVMVQVPVFGIFLGIVVLWCWEKKPPVWWAP